MTPTSEERRKVAEELRNYMRLRSSDTFEAFYTRLNGVLFGDDGFDRPDSDVFECLSGLMDPTCNIDVMDTGERADYDCREHIIHCKNCGAEFGYVLFSEEGDVSMDDKPSYCPNCGDRVAERGER